MEERTVELTIISANDLKKVVKFGKQTCYAVAYINPKKTKKTRKDSDGGTDPSWNDKLVFTCEEQRLRAGESAFTIELYSDGTFSDKLIGTVTVPLSDIANEALSKTVKNEGEEKEGEEKGEKEESKGVHDAQYLAFEVRRPSGKAKGVLNVAIKLGEKRTIQMYQNQPPGAHNGQTSYQAQVPYPATGYPNQGPGYPNQYGQPQLYGPPQPYMAPPPPQYGNQYPQQGPYYPQQPAPYYPQQPPPYYQQQAPRRGGGGGMGLGLGAGLLGGALGGLLVADIVDDIGDDCGDFE